MLSKRAIYSISMGVTQSSNAPFHPFAIPPLPLSYIYIYIHSTIEEVCVHVCVGSVNILWINSRL